MRNAKREGSAKPSALARPRLEEDIDSLFRLPLSEFTPARNELASRLSRSGHREESGTVRELTKPSVSAWAVNQLYWRNQDLFDDLLKTSTLVAKAQSQHLAGKNADLRSALAAKHQTLEELSRIASGILRESGHGVTPETLRRIVTTLEALSIHAALGKLHPVGRLTQDVQPPGLESLSALVPGGATGHEPAGASSSTKAATPQLEERDKADAVRAEENFEAAEHKLRAKNAEFNRIQSDLSETAKLVEKAESDRRETKARLARTDIALKESRRRFASLKKQFEKSHAQLQDAEASVERARQELRKYQKTADKPAPRTRGPR